MKVQYLSTYFLSIYTGPLEVTVFSVFLAMYTLLKQQYDEEIRIDYSLGLHTGRHILH